MMRIAAALLASVVCVAPLGATAQAPRTPIVEATLALRETEVPPGGRTLALVELAMPPGWHTYWKNPGDAGESPTIAWSLPPGYAAGPLRYPPPLRLVEAGDIAVYAYKNHAPLLVELSLPASARPGDRAIVSADLTYLVCEKVCIPESAKLQATLTVAEASSAAASGPQWERALRAHAEYASAEPRPTLKATVDGAKTRLDIGGLPSADPIAGAYFFPDEWGLVDHSANQRISKVGDALVIETERAATAPVAPSVAGLLVIDLAGGGRKAYEIAGPVVKSAP